MNWRWLWFLAAIVVIILVVWWLLPGDKAYYKMDVQEIDQDIRRISKEDWPIQERMRYYSERFLGAPYELLAEGDGPYAKYDQAPLLNLKKVNCMTYCEIVMALSLSDYYADFNNILQNIRYDKGIIGMATRNHYTMADWKSANSWCLDDVTKQIGREDTRKLERMISHQQFFASKDIYDIPLMRRDRNVTIDYIPLAKLSDHSDRLRTGDVVALIQDAEGIFSAHMLLIIKEQEKIFFRHASMSADETIDSEFRDYIQGLEKNRRYLGMSFMRLKSEINWRAADHYYGKFNTPVPVIPRKEWGAAVPVNEGEIHTPEAITLHHTAIEYTGTPPVEEHLQSIQAFHQQQKGWIDIAYHFLIDRDGQVYQGRPLRWVGDSSTDYDLNGKVLVCVLGNFETQEPSSLQIESLKRLCTDLIIEQQISLQNISTHREETDETLCPGKNLIREIDKDDFIKDIEELVRVQT